MNQKLGTKRFYSSILTKVVCLLFVCAVSKSEARNLTDVLEQGFTLTFPTFNLNTGNLARSISPAFGAAVSQAVTQQFPLASVSPAYTFRYNPALSVFERTTGVPGPVFSERALTLGDGRLNFGVGYSYVDFDSLNGTDLDDVANVALVPDPSVREAARFFVPIPGSSRVDQRGIAPFVLSQIRTRIDLQAHVIVPTVRYGITDRWDISLNIPIINTSLKIREESVPVVVAAPSENAGYFYGTAVDGSLVDPGLERGLRRITPPNFPPVGVEELSYVRARNETRRLSRATGSSTGIGDITLRNKYQFWQHEDGGAAFGLNLQFPSGDEDDFHGTGDTYVAAFVYLSQIFQERFEPHLNLGLDFNANDVDRSSFRYAVGASILIWRQLGLIIDFIGASEFSRLVPPGSQDSLSELSDGKFQGFTLSGSSKSCKVSPCRVVVSNETLLAFPENFERNDVIDFSFAIRYALTDSGSIFFAGVVPLNNDGFRSDFIPTGGVEYTF